MRSCDIEKEGYSKSLQDFVERHTSRSTLEFKDKYSKEMSTVDPRSLFEDKELEETPQVEKEKKNSN